MVLATPNLALFLSNIAKLHIREAAILLDSGDTGDVMKELRE